MSFILVYYWETYIYVFINWDNLSYPNYPIYYNKFIKCIKDNYLFLKTSNILDVLVTNW